MLVERSRSGSLSVVTVRTRELLPVSSDGSLILCWSPCVCFFPFTKEIHHGSAPRSDGTGPQTQGSPSRYHPELPAVLPQVHCLPSCAHPRNSVSSRSAASCSTKSRLSNWLMAATARCTPPSSFSIALPSAAPRPSAAFLSRNVNPVRCPKP